MTDRPWLAHYDSGVPHAIDISPIALPELLAAAHDFPAAPAILFYGTTISYSELDVLAWRFFVSLLDQCMHRVPSSYPPHWVSQDIPCFDPLNGGKPKPRFPPNLLSDALEICQAPLANSHREYAAMPGPVAGFILA